MVRAAVPAKVIFAVFMAVSRFLKYTLPACLNSKEKIGCKTLDMIEERNSGTFVQRQLANDGQDTRALQHYLGHKNIQHTVRYTELSPERFRDFWKD